jgi:cell division protein FtsB
MRKVKKFRFGTVILLMLFVYLAYTAVGQQKILFAKKIEMDKVQNKVSDELKTNDDLKKQQKMLNSDEYNEKVARDKLGMVKQNEKVFVDIGK